MPARIDPDLERDIVKAYLGGKSSYQVAAQFQVSVPTVLQSVRRNGGFVRSPRKYTLDDHFFDDIDTESKAYFLGFIAADGCIRHNKLGLNLQARDRGQLEKFRRALKTNHPIYEPVYRSQDGKAFPGVSLEVFSPQLVRSLVRYGITPRKSLTLRPPSLPTELARHFWRGELDGDGSIGVRHRGQQAPWAEIRLLGTQAILEGFAFFIGQFAVSKASPPKIKGRHVWCITYGGVLLPQKILHVLYDGAAFFLDRKKEKAEEVFKLKVSEPYRLDIFGEKVYSTYKTVGTWNSTAKALGYPISSALFLKQIYYQYCRGRGLSCQQD